jgi:DNA transformation protein
MFALIDDGVIFLKADAATIPNFERENSVPFSYSTKHGSRTLSSYWRLPERLYDEPEELAQWAAAALAAAQAGAKLRPRRAARMPSRRASRGTRKARRIVS